MLRPLLPFAGLFLAAPLVAQQTLVASRVVDAAPGGQPPIFASSMPTLGQLYPLSENLFVDPNGSIGMGTLFPGASLDVITANNDARFRIFDFNSTGVGQLVGEFTGGNGAGALLRFAGASAGGFVDLGQASNGNFQIRTSSGLGLTMLQNRRIGIGTESPITGVDVENGVWIDRNAFGLNEGAIMTNHADDARAGYIGPFSATEYVLGVHEGTGTFIDGGIVHNTVTGESSVFADVKNFRQTNPANPETDIVYACVEGPEAAAYVRGTGTLENGHAKIDLPDHFQMVSSGTGVTVHVTPRSADSRGLAVVEREDTHFEVRELLRGTGTYEFDWEIKAVRKGYEQYEVIRPKFRSPELVRPVAAPVAAPVAGPVAGPVEFVR